MPNWCENVLTIRAPKETLDIIESGAKEGKLLQTLAPLPPHDKDNWYATQVATWGTKWDIRSDDMFIDRHDDFITFNFDSAWNPPLKALETAVGESFKDITELEMIYFEGGCAFCGIALYEAGGHFSEDTYATPESKEERDALIASEPVLGEWVAERYPDDFFDEDEDA
jgi:hypothetical protein